MKIRNKIKRLSLVLFVGLIVLCLSPVHGQYLRISKSGNIREHFDVNSQMIERAEKGEYYVMIQAASDETNSYYEVQCKESNRRGWIYRTLVRRFEEPIPEPEPDLNERYTLVQDLVVHVIDDGAAVCNVISLPDGRYIIIDAGHWRGNGNTTLEKIDNIIPLGSQIELMIISHTDGDHVGSAGNIINNYRVRKVVHTGFEKSLVNYGTRTVAYSRFEEALNSSNRPHEEVNLFELDSNITPGISRQFGNVELTYLCGFGRPLPEWNLRGSEALNSVSIVVKLSYQGVSVLFTGDAVGRHIGYPPNTLIATEEYLVTNASGLLNSDILIAPHHGADNANTEQFICGVSPEYVIFCAGHRHEHPYAVAVERYLVSVELGNIFRTDRGDNEGGNEWSQWSLDGCVDPHGDDDIEIIINSDGEYLVRYVNANEDCLDL